MQMELFGQPEAYTVSDLTRYIREMFEVDYRLQDVWVQGEVSNLSRPASGHVYFSLKDAGAQIRCVMWRTAAQQSAAVRDGDVVVAHGRVSVYESQGSYQLYVDVIQPAGGVGDLYRQFELLKAKLQAEGLFDAGRKRPLPGLPRRIGIVTSPTGAALRDLLNVLSRRWPLLEVIVAPTQVQGEAAPPQIVAALKRLFARGDLDAIIVARGGGSIEDLWAFNDERVARAIAAAPVPVISGVGHETDFTIADFVADVRAPTPSAAAELVSPSRDDYLMTLDAHSARLSETMRERLDTLRARLDAGLRALGHLSPQARLVHDRQRLDDLSESFTAALGHRIALWRERLAGAAARLNALSPLAVLDRGYAVVRQAKTGTIVRSVKQAKAGDRLNVRVSDGEFEVRSE
ncbi:MAG TPA: exodeoxyribonuclease VII large subunit [Anaerolineae bacterium]|nr:exodeoxyribonuclease VII large subunit [Anaerolineae bacterium]